ncbi:MAG TPA: hypothetical protein ENG33_11060 [Chloroflexi bacterium]|nr:hypothetical protein [Chloroflexota bacterium]
MPLVWMLIAVIGLLCGALYHLRYGKGFRDLAIHLIAGIMGFAIGHLGGQTFLRDFPLTLGDLHIFEGILVSFLSLFLVDWLKV